MGGSSEVMRARLSDGEVRALTHTGSREESWPYWSPSARRLVFQVAPALTGAASDLVLWGPEAGETPLVETPGRDERWPAWSPRGRRLVYVFRGPGAEAGVAWVDLARGETEILARSGPRDLFFRANFAPDGRRLVAQRRDPSGKGSNLWILARGSPPRRLTRDPGWFDTKAWFTRDGEHVVYSRRPAGGGPREIVIAEVDGGSRRVIASTPHSDDHSARPSPTRDEIAFVSDRSGSSQVLVADLDGEVVRPITDSPERSHVAPRWSPDGDRLVVTFSPADGAPPRLVDRSSLQDTRIAVVDRRGGVLFETEGFMPDWMPPWP